MRALTEEEKNTFDLITGADCPQLALISTELDGIETSCISLVSQDGQEFMIQPLAVIVNNEIFSKLKALDF